MPTSVLPAVAWAPKRGPAARLLSRHFVPRPLTLPNRTAVLEANRMSADFHALNAYLGRSKSLRMEGMSFPDSRFALLDQAFQPAHTSANLLVLETIAILLNVLVSARLLFFVWTLGKRMRVAKGMIWMCAILSIH